MKCVVNFTSGQQSQTELRLYFGVCILQKFQQSGHRDGRFACGGYSLWAGAFLFGVETFLELPAQLYTGGLLDMGVGVHQHICRGMSGSSLNSFYIAAGDYQLIGRTGVPQTVKDNAGELRVCILPLEELFADQHRLHSQTVGQKDISLRRKPVYQGDLDDIEMYFMAAVKEIKKGIGSHYAEQEAMSKKVAEKMFNELTKGQDVQHPTITAEQLTDAILDSVSGMEGATPEALEQLRNGLLGILQSAAEQESRRELYDGLKRLPQREQTYLLYRYGFTDGEEHPLIGTAIYFHLTKGRAKKTEEQAMDNLWLELPWWLD